MTIEIEEVARICHEVNRALCNALGDTSHRPWEEAPLWQRLSAIAGVRAHMYGEVSTPEESHNLWLAHKQRDGWKYGPVKDAEKREHPCMVPYNQLPPEQRAKDFIFTAIVKTLQEIQGEKMGDGIAGR